MLVEILKEDLIIKRSRRRSLRGLYPLFFFLTFLRISLTIFEYYIRIYIFNTKFTLLYNSRSTYI